MALTVPAMAVAANVDVSATPANPNPGDAVALVATAPAYTQSASLTQEIVQQFDPAYLRISGAADVTAPQGWALSYSTDGTTFSSSTPADWGTVRAVKATGNLDADGASGARQIAVASESVTTPAPAPIASGGGGDGWDTAFDDSGHVFNMFHHMGVTVLLSSAITTGTGALDCHLRSNGARCAGAWPFNVNALGIETNGASTEWVDSAHGHVWFPTTDNLGNGFACIDVSNNAAPQLCGGSLATGYFRLGASVDLGSKLWGGGSGQPYRGLNTGNALLAESGGRLYTWDRDTGHILCIDTQANDGAGAECPGGPVAIPGVSIAQWELFAGTLNAPTTYLFDWGGRIYGSAGAGGTTAVCIVAATNQACPGWSPTKTLTHYPYNVYRQPRADGSIDGACFVTISGAAECFDEVGTAFAGVSTLGTNIKAGMVGWWRGIGVPNTVDSRVYFFDAGTAKLKCWDRATATNCPGFGASGVTATNVYATNVDPINNQCIWTNSDGSGIHTIDSSGASPCTATPARVTMNSDVVIPRMGCTSGGGITRWQRFTLATPTLGGGGGATSATLTVRKADGGLIAGWSNITINPADGQVDLSGLDIADSGQKPQFQIDFVGRQGSATTTHASVVAVGESPSLCIAARAQAVTCPAAYGPPTSNLPWTATVTGGGSVTPGGSSTEAYGTGTATIAAGGASTTECVLPTPPPTPPAPPAAEEPPPAVISEATPPPKVSRPPAAGPPGTIIETVEVPGPGKVMLVGTRSSGTRACTSIVRTMSKAGTTTLACRVNASTRALLRSRAVCVTVWAIYTPGSGTASRVASRICLPRRTLPAVTG